MVRKDYYISIVKLMDERRIYLNRLVKYLVGLSVASSYDAAYLDTTQTDTV